VNGERVVQALGIYRAFAGMSVWLAPSQMARVFALAYAGRLAAVRELTLGVGLLISHGDARRTWLRLALLCDLSDTLAAATGTRSGGLPAAAAARGGAATITSGLLTLAALRSGSG